MIINDDPKTVLRTNVNEEHQFTIKATAQSFSILSSGLYSNKTLAVVRELCANAFDAHIEAGKGDIPFEVRLPNSLIPTFSVKDFGTGLSREAVYSLYTTYFDSTKSSSNDFVGQLGLGSKSPFSYASSFIVESRFNGENSCYSCFKDEEGLPTITLLGSSPTDEPNGLTVQLSIKNQDIYSFNESARKALMYYNPMPVILGGTSSVFKPYDLQHTLCGSNWKVRDCEGYSPLSGPCVVQGVIVYPINGEILREHGLSKIASMLTYTAIDMEVPIGRVSVSASRESLHYNTTTIKNLVEVFENAAVEVQTTIQSQFDDCSSAWEVAMLMDQLRNKSGSEFGKIFNSFARIGQPFVWNGQPVTNTITIDTAGIKNTKIIWYIKGKGKAKVSGIKVWTPASVNYNNECELVVEGRVAILTDTAYKADKALYHEYMNDIKSSDPMMIVLSPIAKNGFDQAEVDKLIASIGCPEVTSIEREKTSAIRSKYVYKKRNNTERLRWTGFPMKESYYRSEVRRVYSRLCWSKESIDITAGGYYMPIERFYVTSPSSCGVRIDDLIYSAMTLGILKKDDNIYGFTKTEIESLPSNLNWINVFDHIKTQFEILSQDGTLYGTNIMSKIRSEIGYEFCNKVIDNWDNVGHSIKDGKFKTHLEKIHTFAKSATLDLNVSKSVHVCASLLGVSSDWGTIASQIYDEWWLLVSKEYPMLQYVSTNSVNREQVQMMINYVNLIEKQLLTLSEI